MKILVTGNGFDIAHNYNTRYTDFLCACAIVLDKQDIIQSIINKNRIKNKNYPLSKNKIQNFKVYSEEISSNAWIKFFLDKMEEFNSNWIDLEEVIKEVVISYLNINGKNSGFIKRGYSNYFLSENEMKRSFEEFKNILNLYLYLATSTKNQIIYKEVVDFMPDYIVNFNYTNTFTKEYEGVVEIDYVHGRIMDPKNGNSIVIGMNETGNPLTDSTMGEFIKYFQMVKNKIQINVLEKIQKSQHLEVLIFGHSLSETDKDILLPLLNKADKIRILYHNEESLNNLVKELIKTINSKEKFLDLCFNKNNRLVFEKLKKCTKGKDYAYNRDCIKIAFKKTLETNEECEQVIDFLIQYENKYDKSVLVNFINKVIAYKRDNDSPFGDYLIEDNKEDKITEILRANGLNIYNYYHNMSYKL